VTQPYAHTEVCSGSIHVIPAIPACPVRPKSGASFEPPGRRGVLLIYGARESVAEKTPAVPMDLIPCGMAKRSIPLDELEKAADAEFKQWLDDYTQYKAALDRILRSRSATEPAVDFWKAIRRCRSTS
jgi:hypothetical protein